MITAQEARELAAVSDANIKIYLDKVDKVIRDAAAAGKRTVPCYVDKLWATFSPYTEPTMTPIQKRVMEALKAFPNNFAVMWGKDGESYIPRALENDDNATMIQNYCLIISF